ncbi:MAG: acylphosphatase [bacterium]|jgi:acylphosphatase|nr:acylphosphatase [bacterium]
MRQVKLRITGKVQGVFYRASTREKAQQLGIKGWVKNEPDGTVSAVGQGPGASLQQWIDWCREGPSEARVESVEVKDQPIADFQQFEIIR